MIFKKLTLTNFRVFNDEHVIDLQPRKEDLFVPPIVLFGGLNGAGKTSILTAIRLLLMGRKAIGPMLNNKEYSTYLAQQLNNNAKKEQEAPLATISLEFSHTHRGIHSIFTITRSWGIDGKEQITFQHNNTASDLTPEQVQSLLSEMIPPGIGDLFFFDGEKIAELAEDDTGIYLKEAVNKLLGLDIIERLNIDLDIYLNKESETKASKSIQKDIADIQTQKIEYKQKAELAQNEATIIHGKVVTIRQEINNLEKSIAERGGAFAITKDKEKQKQKSLETDIATTSGKILSELDGAFPLSLAQNAIASLFEQLEKEQSAKEQQAFSNQLKTQAKTLTEQLATNLTANENDINQVIENFIKDNENQIPKGSIKLDISSREFHQLTALKADAEQSNKNLAEAITELKQAENKYDALATKIQRAPDEKELIALYDRLRVLDVDLVKEKEAYKAKLTEAQKAMAKALELAKRLEKLYNLQKNEKSLQKAVTRVNSTQKVLNEFTAKLTLLRVEQLEQLFASAYRKLARKGDLKLSAKIDPVTFDVTLVDLEGMEINRKSLSAGEKQIFAFAILEALGKLSGKILPVIVDTPLGRLDSKHRDKLIKHYFPSAGEQVILLSTDTEVDEDFYSILAPEVSHAFEISFDQQTRCSTLTEGYFWQNTQKEAV